MSGGKRPNWRSHESFLKKYSMAPDGVGANEVGARANAMPSIEIQKTKPMKEKRSVDELKAELAHWEASDLQGHGVSFYKSRLWRLLSDLEATGKTHFLAHRAFSGENLPLVKPEQFPENAFSCSLEYDR